MNLNLPNTVAAALLLAAGAGVGYISAQPEHALDSVRKLWAAAPSPTPVAAAAPAPEPAPARPAVHPFEAYIGRRLWHAGGHAHRVCPEIEKPNDIDCKSVAEGAVYVRKLDWNAAGRPVVQIADASGYVGWVIAWGGMMPFSVQAPNPSGGMTAEEAFDLRYRKFIWLECLIRHDLLVPPEIGHERFLD